MKIRRWVHLLTVKELKYNSYRMWRAEFDRSTGQYLPYDFKLKLRIIECIFATSDKLDLIQE